MSRDGWLKRQKEVRDLSTTSLREGDTVLAVLPGSTRATIALFTNFGVAYTARIADVPASTGYGEPMQKLFKFRDGERVIAAFGLDPRVAGQIVGPEGKPPPLHALAVTSDGYSLRFSLGGVVEPSTRTGRRYARPTKGAEVVGVVKVTGGEIVIAATEQALHLRRDTLFPVTGHQDSHQFRHGAFQGDRAANGRGNLRSGKANRCHRGTFPKNCSQRKS